MPTTNRRATNRRKADVHGERGPRGERGPAGPGGPTGPAGPPGPKNHRYDGLAEIVERIADELKVQFQRFAQIQQQLDEVARALKQMQQRQALTERMEPAADRQATIRRSS